MAEMHLSFYAPSLGRTVNLRAMVPVDGMGVALDAPQEPLPALYLLHGLYGSENDWFNYTRVILWARQHGMAVFCPAGENGFYVNKPSGGEDFLRFLGEDLVNFTRKLFPLSHRREDTFIAGLSMGGYGALNAAFTYPDIFGKAAALSAALRPWTFMENPAGDALHHEPFKRSLFGDDPTPFDTLTLAQRCGARCPALWMACGHGGWASLRKHSLCRRPPSIGHSRTLRPDPRRAHMGLLEPRDRTRYRMDGGEITC